MKNINKNYFIMITNMKKINIYQIIINLILNLNKKENLTPKMYTTKFIAKLIYSIYPSIIIKKPLKTLIITHIHIKTKKINKKNINSLNLKISEILFIHLYQSNILHF
jgi:hypothetical protein